VEGGRDTETLQASVGDEAKILTHIAERKTGDATREENRTTQAEISNDIWLR
jgi:hypothetical protein